MPGRDRSGPHGKGARTGRNEGSCDSENLIIWNRKDRKVESKIRTFALPCEGEGGLEGRLSDHFGRCRTFTLVDIEEGGVKGHRVIENPLAVNHPHGRAPRFIAEQGVQGVLVRGIGRRACELFEELGIEARLTEAETVSAAVQDFLSGGTRKADPCKGHQGHGHGRGHGHHRIAGSGKPE